MDTIRVVLALLLLAGALWNARLAIGHVRNLIGYRRRVNVSLGALEKGEVPPYPLALADHLERVAEKGPVASNEKVRWDWVGMTALGLALAVLFGLVGIWTWPS